MDKMTKTKEVNVFDNEKLYKGVYVKISLAKNNDNYDHLQMQNKKLKVSNNRGDYLFLVDESIYEEYMLSVSEVIKGNAEIKIIK